MCRVLKEHITMESITLGSSQGVPPSAGRLIRFWRGLVACRDPGATCLCCAHPCALAACRYKQLLLKQRDIMIALTARLNERDEQIMTLQVRSQPPA